MARLPELERLTNAAEIITDYDLMAVPSPPAPRDGSGSRSRVLIADDNADMRLYLSRLLSERYDVKAVPNGQAALEAIREQLPDLVLSDVMMPELDGFGLLRELRANAEQLLFLSSSFRQEPVKSRVSKAWMPVPTTFL